MQQTDAGKLKAIREEIGLSMRDFADILQISKPAYQGYESGRRSIPPGIMDKAKAQLQRTRAYWRTLPNRVEGRIDQEFPNGIMSEVMG